MYRDIVYLLYIFVIIIVFVICDTYDNFIYSNNFINNCKYNIIVNDLYQHILCYSLLWLYIILLLIKNIIYFYIICEVHPY